MIFRRSSVGVAVRAAVQIFDRLCFDPIGSRIFFVETVLWQLQWAPTNCWAVLPFPQLVSAVPLGSSYVAHYLDQHIYTRRPLLAIFFNLTKLGEVVEDVLLEFEKAVVEFLLGTVHNKLAIKWLRRIIIVRLRSEEGRWMLDVVESQSQILLGGPLVLEWEVGENDGVEGDRPA